MTAFFCAASAVAAQRLDALSLARNVNRVGAVERLGAAVKDSA